MRRKQTNSKYTKRNGRSNIDQFKDYLTHRALNQHVYNSSKLYREIQPLGFNGAYATVNRYVNELENSASIKKPISPVNSKPGEQAQVDWGHFGTIMVNGRKEKLYCFVYILAFSRMIYIEFTIRQNLQTLEECHINAFEALGIPAKIVYDNMKTVVLKREKLPDGEHIHFNPAFLEFASYYRFQPDPTPPYWPRAKGKVEAGVKYVRYHFMKGIKTEKITLDDLNKSAKQWVKSKANIRVHRTTGVKPKVLWEREKPSLRFLNGHPSFITTSFEERHVTAYSMVQYYKSFYSVPIEYARKKVLVKAVNKSGVVTLHIYYHNRLIAMHFVSTEPKQFITKKEHFIKRSERRSKKAYKKKQYVLSIPIRPLTDYIAHL